MKVLVSLSMLVALTLAEPPSFRQSFDAERDSSYFYFARHQPKDSAAISVEAAAPYPASGWKPDGPAFDPTQKQQELPLPTQQQFAPSEAAQNQYGAPAAAPQRQYGAPAAAPQRQYGAPAAAPQRQYGAPAAAPQRQYGAPAAAPQRQYGAPAAAPQRQYGAPAAAPQRQYGAPAAAPQRQYGAPAAAPQRQYGAPAAAPQQQYGAPEDSPQEETQAPTAPQQRFRAQAPFQRQYGPPAAPQQQYGAPNQEATTTEEATSTEYDESTTLRGDTESQAESVDSVNELDDVGEVDAEQRESGEYFVALPDGRLQRVRSMSRKDLATMKLIASVTAENVEPLRGPIYAYSPLQKLEFAPAVLQPSVVDSYGAPQKLSLNPQQSQSQPLAAAAPVNPALSNYQFPSNDQRFFITI
ncbi:pro-resilin-like [Venturia canescens]|uniref:pro-resilin-like n=1 Tax=Venturia canescens TaxID=32260 RepID=UPI001C9D12A7|nr:pro-resilin-like [Venturia canescens]